MFNVYWIHHKDHTDMFSQGYVGVTNNVKRRWFRHSRYSENQHLKNAIRKYGWDNLIKEVIIVANKSYCYAMETKLRPEDQIGWNISAGGSQPPVAKPRGENYVSPLKGKTRPTPWMTGRKKSAETRRKLSEQRKIKVKYLDVIYDSFEDLADFIGIKYSTLTNRIYRNAQKYGYEVLK
jgi:predicted GIY-YIG superfamily endonuclease